MFNIGGGELLVIVLVALIVLGPQRLPDAMRTFGRVVGEVRRISSGFQQELRDAFEDSDVAEAASPPRRREAVPLAATVAEANPEADTDPEAVAAPDAAPESPPSDGTAADTGTDASPGTSVAPVIAEALDAIVAPIDPPAAVDPPGSDGATADDERAAS
jgi:sec-independent protein translocase protein TatB